MKINIKDALIKFIYYFSLVSIIFGMLRVLFLNNSIINSTYMGLSICIVVMSFWYIILSYKRLNFNFLSKFLIIFLIYEIVISFLTKTISFSRWGINTLGWPFLIMVFNDYTSKKDVKFIEKSIFKFYLFLVFLSLFLIRRHLIGQGNAGQVIFPTYFCFSFLPLLLKYEKKEKKRNLCIILSVIIIVATTKRTGTIVVLLGSFLYYLSKIHIEGNLRIKINKYFKFIIVLLLCGFIGYICVNNSNLKIIERFSQIEEDGGSGRSGIWNKVLYAYNNSSNSEKIFGHGGQSVMYYLQPGGYYRYAHNTFIEYLYDYGQIGLGLLIFLNLYLVIKECTLLKNKDPDAPTLMYLIIVSLLLSLFSYYYEQTFIIIPCAIYLGCMDSLVASKKERRD